MATTGSRVLQLLSLLQTHRYWPGQELADRLEVSLRTLRRDVDRLRELGYPVQAQRGVDGGYQLAAGASLPPLVLDDEEAVALAVGLLSTTQAPVAGTAEASARALAKVVQVMPARLRRRAEALRAVTEPVPAFGGQPLVDGDVLTAIAQACRDGERVRFGYRAAGAEERGRHAEPHRMVALGRRWYLVAYDLDRQDWRTFRLDRIRAVQPTGDHFAPRRLPATDAAEFVRTGIAEAPRAYDIVVDVHADPARVRERLGRWASVEPRPGGGATVRMRTDSLGWPAMAFGDLGAEFTVRAPPELADYLAEWAARFRRATAPPAAAAE